MSDNTIPELFVRLHTEEEALRVKSLQRIIDSQDMSAHLMLVEGSMSLIHALLPSTSEHDADKLMLGNLGIRVFNALAAAIKLLLSGYYQASFLQLRDVLEVAFLLDYFSTDRSLVESWRTLPVAERIQQFSPVKIRAALDNRDGFQEKKREKAYKLLCNYAGHATPEGMMMLVSDNNTKNVNCGPFLDDKKLNAALFECAKLALQTAANFSDLKTDKKPHENAADQMFMNIHSNWSERFHIG